MTPEGIPLRGLHRRMPFDEWQRLPRSPGFKYEYWDGRAHLSPRPFGIPMSKLLEDHPTPPETPAGPEHVAGLVRVYCLCFGPLELTHVPRRKLREQAQKDLADYFRGKRGAPVPEASFVVVRRGRPVAALLVVEGPSVDLVFVHPNHQRQGLGARLLAAAGAALWQAGHRSLGSRVHCHNPGSYRWHTAQGFQEVPDLWVARQRLGVAIWEERRAELLGQDASAWAAEYARLSAEVEELEQAWRQEIREGRGQSPTSGDNHHRP